MGYNMNYYYTNRNTAVRGLHCALIKENNFTPHLLTYQRYRLIDKCTRFEDTFAYRRYNVFLPDYMYIRLCNITGVNHAHNSTDDTSKSIDR